MFYNLQFRILWEEGMQKKIRKRLNYRISYQFVIKILICFIVQKLVVVFQISTLLSVFVE
ncbi:MAG: hypothetical protein FNNCIFGK_01495 [Bacteroidia bacterium]|nr:hypothetical protein [Bacteroidia bacterium]